MGILDALRGQVRPCDRLPVSRAYSRGFVAGLRLIAIMNGCHAPELESTRLLIARKRECSTRMYALLQDATERLGPRPARRELRLVPRAET